MAFTVKDVDNGYEKFVAEVYDDGKVGLEVGVFADALYESGVSVLQVAIWQEFGTPTVPARSFIRAWFDEHQEDILAWFAAELPAVLSGQQTKLDALEKVGMKCVQGIKNRIEIGVPPPNADATVKKKGFDHPLRETGFLESVINYRTKGTRGPSPLRVAIERAMEAPNAEP